MCAFPNEPVGVVRALILCILKFLFSFLSERMLSRVFPLKYCGKLPKSIPVFIGRIPFLSFTQGKMWSLQPGQGLIRLCIASGRFGCSAYSLNCFPSHVPTEGIDTLPNRTFKNTSTICWRGGMVRKRNRFCTWSEHPLLRSWQAPCSRVEFAAAVVHCRK